MQQKKHSETRCELKIFFTPSDKFTIPPILLNLIKKNLIKLHICWYKHSLGVLISLSMYFVDLSSKYLVDNLAT